MVQSDGIELSFCCRLDFSLFHLHHPLQVPLFDNRWLHSLAYFGPHSWHVSGRFYWFKLTTFTCPSVADFFFAFSNFWHPTAPITCSGWWDLWPFFRYYLLYVKRLIWPVQIDPNYLYYHCRLYFRFFTYHPLEVLLFDHGWGHSLASFGPHYWSLIGLFCPLKLLALTYPSVAESIFDISPFWPPAAPNTRKRPVVFISALYASFFGMYLSFYIHLNQYKWPALPLHMLFSVLCLSNSLELPMLNDGWQYPIKIFGTHLSYVNHLFSPLKLILNLVVITSTWTRLPVSRNWEYHIDTKRFDAGRMSATIMCMEMVNPWRKLHR